MKGRREEGKEGGMKGRRDERKEGGREGGMKGRREEGKRGGKGGEGGEEGKGSCDMTERKRESKVSRTLYVPSYISPSSPGDAGHDTAAQTDQPPDHHHVPHAR